MQLIEENNPPSAPDKIRKTMEKEKTTPLNDQLATLLGLTGTFNVLDAIEHVKTLKHLLKTTEEQRKQWADMCIKKQARIEELEIQIK